MGSDLGSSRFSHQSIAQRLPHEDEPKQRALKTRLAELALEEENLAKEMKKLEAPRDLASGKPGKDGDCDRLLLMVFFIHDSS